MLAWLPDVGWLSTRCPLPPEVPIENLEGAARWSTCTSLSIILNTLGGPQTQRERERVLMVQTILGEANSLHGLKVQLRTTKQPNTIQVGGTDRHLEGTSFRPI